MITPEGATIIDTISKTINEVLLQVFKNIP
jgi:hypothetical protein